MTASVAVLGMALFATQVDAAPPAQAVSTCNLFDSIGWSTKGGGSALIPYTGNTASWSRNCSMWAGFYSGSANGAQRLQESLNRCYGENLTTDGIFGWRTEDALARAQADEGIEADGIYGLQTAKNIKFAKYNSSGCGYLAATR
ncbi:hypothetical protein GCM10010413_52740 [Promicromonospora sukumoe]